MCNVTNNNQPISYKQEIKQCVTNLTNLTNNRLDKSDKSSMMDKSSTVINFLGAYSIYCMYFFLPSMQLCLEKNMLVRYLKSPK